MLLILDYLGNQGPYRSVMMVAAGIDAINGILPIKIRSYGDTIEDKRIVYKILRMYSFKIWSYVVAAIEEAKNLSQFSLPETNELFRGTWAKNE